MATPLTWSALMLLGVFGLGFAVSWHVRRAKQRKRDSRGFDVLPPPPTT